jgi:glutathione S-transferase
LRRTPALTAASEPSQCGPDIAGRGRPPLPLRLQRCVAQFGRIAYEGVLMITLYHRAKSRSTRFIFLLEELAAPYRIQHVTIRSHDGSGAVDPANPHPHGKVPAISDDGVVVFESPAIALYLTDKFPDKGLGPRIGDRERGAYLSWLSYYSGVLEPAFMSKFMNTEVPRGSAGWVCVDEAMAAVIAALAPGPYILGERFSAADVLYGTTFALFAQSPLLPKSPVIDEYVKRIVARPAFARAQERDAA